MIPKPKEIILYTEEMILCFEKMSPGPVEILLCVVEIALCRGEIILYKGEIIPGHEEIIPRPEEMIL